MAKLYDTLQDYAASKPIRFHMPGHNGIDLGLDSSMDITELDFSDNLIHPESVIRQCEDNIAKVYSTQYALMVTCGATSAIAIALHTARVRGDRLVILGDAHKSVYNYANIFGYKVIEKKLEDGIKISTCDVAVLTTPNYFGEVFPLPRERDYMLIVDQSHGSHFPISSTLPSSNGKDCDIAVMSFHKTLPVLTGGAGIVCNDKEIYQSLLLSRSILHSSSPNYLIMASIDKAFSDILSYTCDPYIEVKDSIEKFKRDLNQNYVVVHNADYSRIVIQTRGDDAAPLAKVLESHNIYIEMTYEDKLVLIVTPFNHMYLPRLLEVLNNINYKANEVKKTLFTPQKSISFNQNEGKLYPIEECENKVCLTTIGVYPPGVPILVKGDIISSDIISFLKDTKCEIFGMVNQKIYACENGEREICEEN